MSTQVFDKALGILIEFSWELHLLVKGHLKDLVRILSHEWWSSVETLINENAKSIPVYWVVVALVLNDFWGYVLWGATESVGPVTRHESLDEAKISKLDIPVLLDKHVLRLQVSVDKVKAMKVL